MSYTRAAWYIKGFCKKIDLDCTYKHDPSKFGSNPNLRKRSNSVNKARLEADQIVFQTMILPLNLTDKVLSVIMTCPELVSKKERLNKQDSFLFQGFEYMKTLVMNTVKNRQSPPRPILSYPKNVEKT